MACACGEDEAHSPRNPFCSATARVTRWSRGVLKAACARKCHVSGGCVSGRHNLTYPHTMSSTQQVAARARGGGEHVGGPFAKQLKRLTRGTRRVHTLQEFTRTRRSPAHPPKSQSHSSIARTLSAPITALLSRTAGNTRLWASRWRVLGGNNSRIPKGRSRHVA